MISLMQGDCLELLRSVPDNSVDLVVTSPPYDSLRTYNGNMAFNFEIFKGIATEILRVVVEGGVVVWIVNDGTEDGSETGTSFRQALYFKEIGFKLFDTMIWAKDTMNFPDPTRYGQSFEYMFILSKGKPKTFNPISDKPNKWAGTKVHGTSRDIDGTVFRKINHNKTVVNEYGKRMNVWNMGGEKHNTTGHPAVFPLDLAQDHIISWSNKGDTVLDCFMGSGTTGVACYNLNRNFIGMEIDETYFKLAESRINDVQAQIRMDISV